MQSEDTIESPVAASQENAAAIETSDPVDEVNVVVNQPQLAEVVLKAPEGTSTVSVAGHEYPVNQDGTVLVPWPEASDLLNHGFTIYGSAHD